MLAAGRVVRPHQGRGTGDVARYQWGILAKQTWRDSGQSWALEDRPKDGASLGSAEPVWSLVKGRSANSQGERGAGSQGRGWGMSTKEKARGHLSAGTFWVKKSSMVARRERETDTPSSSGRCEPPCCACARRGRHTPPSLTALWVEVEAGRCRTWELKQGSAGGAGQPRTADPARHGGPQRSARGGTSSQGQPPK